MWEADSGGLRFAQCSGAGDVCAQPGAAWTTPADVPGTSDETKHPYAAANADGDLFVVYEVDTTSCNEFTQFDGQVEVRWRCASDGLWYGPSIVADDADGCAALAWGNGHSWAPIVYDPYNAELDVAFVWDDDEDGNGSGTTPTVMAHGQAPAGDFACP